MHSQSSSQWSDTIWRRQRRRRWTSAIPKLKILFDISLTGLYMRTMTAQHSEHYEKYPPFKAVPRMLHKTPFPKPCHSILYSFSLHHITERSLQVLKELSHDAPLHPSPPGVSIRHRLSTGLTARLPYVTHLFGSGTFKGNTQSD